MGLNVAYHYVHPAVEQVVGFLEHGVGLANTGAVAEKDFQLAFVLFWFFRTDLFEQRIGVWAQFVFGHSGHPLS